MIDPVLISRALARFRQLYLRAQGGGRDAHPPAIFKSRRALSVTLSVILISLSVIAPCAASDTAQLLRRAQEALSAKRYSVAVELYLRLWAETQDSGALFNIAIIKYRQRALRESEEYLDRYIKASGARSDDQRVLALRERIRIAQENPLSTSTSTATSTASADSTSTTPGPSASAQGEAPTDRDRISPVDQDRTAPVDQAHGDTTAEPSRQVSSSTHQPLAPDMNVTSSAAPLPDHQSWITPTLYSIGAVSALSALGLYAYANHAWDESEGGAYLERFEARRQAETLTWVGDGLMLSGVVILVYTALRPSAAVPDASAYRLGIHRDALTLNITF